MGNVILRLFACIRSADAAEGDELGRTAGRTPLYYSAYGNEADTALDACGDAYLKKPVSIAEIESLIVKMLAGTAS